MTSLGLGRGGLPRVRLGLLVGLRVDRREQVADEGVEDREGEEQHEADAQLARRSSCAVAASPENKPEHQRKLLDATIRHNPIFFS